VKSGNACYHSAQNLLSSNFLSQNVQVMIYKTVILPLILYRCEAWFLTMREEKCSRIGCWERYAGLSGARRQGSENNYITRSRMICTPYHILFGCSNRKKWARHVACMGDRRSAHKVLVGRLEGKKPIGRPTRRWQDKLKWKSKKRDGEAWNDCSVGTGGGRLWMR
jgi:hypothetical protein